MLILTRISSSFPTEIETSHANEFVEAGQTKKGDGSLPIYRDKGRTGSEIYESRETVRFVPGVKVGPCGLRAVEVFSALSAKLIRYVTRTPSTNAFVR
jgi:hypothetical protein